MQFSGSIWAALALSDWLVRFVHLLLTRGDQWAAYWALQYTVVHVGLLFVIGYFVAKLTLRARPAFGLVLVIANTLFLCVLFSYQVWQIKSGSHTSCVGIGDAMSLTTERHCYWRNGQITPAGALSLTQNAVIQLLINIALVSCAWLGSGGVAGQATIRPELSASVETEASIEADTGPRWALAIIIDFFLRFSFFFLVFGPFAFFYPLMLPYGPIYSLIHLLLLVPVASVMSKLNLAEERRFRIGAVSANILFVILILVWEAWNRRYSQVKVCNEYGTDCRWKPAILDWSYLDMVLIFIQISINVISEWILWRKRPRTGAEPVPS